MRKITPVVILVLVSCFMTLVSGCRHILPTRYEIDDLVFIRTIAIDKEQSNNGGVEFTIVSKRLGVGGQDGQQGAEKQANIMSSKGKTIFEAVRRFHTFSEQKVFWGHNEFILLGEDAARDNILKYIDFIVRDAEFRLNSRVLLVKGGTAKEVLSTTNTPQYFVSDRLENLIEKRGLLSISGETKLVELISMLESPGGGQCMPYIYLSNKEFEKGRPQQEAINDIVLGGYGVLKEGKLLGFLPEDASRGCNWVKNMVDSGVILVKDFEGNPVSLEIIDAKSKITPKLEGGNLSVLVRIEMSSNIAEIQSTENVFSEEALRYFRRQQEEIIKSEVWSVINYSQKNEVDFLMISSYVRRRYPVEWQRLEKEWKEIFPEVEFQVEVASKINRTYVIQEPIKSRTGKKQ